MIVIFFIAVGDNINSPAEIFSNKFREFKTVIDL